MVTLFGCDTCTSKCLQAGSSWGLRKSFQGLRKRSTKFSKISKSISSLGGQCTPQIKSTILNNNAEILYLGRPETMLRSRFPLRPSQSLKLVSLFGREHTVVFICHLYAIACLALCSLQVSQGDSVGGTKSDLFVQQRAPRAPSEVSCIRAVECESLKSEVRVGILHGN